MEYAGIPINRIVSRKGEQQYDSGILYDQSPTRSFQMELAQQNGVLASPSPYVSPLPPAVANVPKEDIRGFLHHKRVGNYLLGRTLGEGSFAKVKEGMHVQTGEKVAIKVIDKKKAKDDSYVAKNMRREARLLQQINHPNVIKLLEVIETDNSYYLVTELCSGGELMQHIYKQNYLEEAEVRKYVRQIASAIDHLHKCNIIHRDLKVENLLLDANMDLRIIDFGLSNIYLLEKDDGTMEQCLTQCGSPAYAAPELLGHKTYGPEVDIWSIGVNMYAMLTGRLPFTVEPFNIAALHAKMLENKMEPIPDHLSSSCRDLMCKMMNPNPKNRIGMEDVMKHPWLNVGLTVPFGPAPHPGIMKEEEINQDILEHMKHCLNVSVTISEIKSCLLNNRAVQSSAIYWLLDFRLKRYIKQHHPKRSKPRKLSFDDGFCDVIEEEKVHLPKTIKRTGSKGRNKMKRSSTAKDVTTLMKDMRLSSTERDVNQMRRSSTERDVTTLVKGSSEATSLPSRRNSSRLNERRKSLPVEELQNGIRMMNTERSMTLPTRSRSNSSSVDTTPNDNGLVALTINTDRHRLFPSVSPGSPFESSSEEGYHLPVTRNSSGELKAIKQIRQTLGRTVHPTAAWTSQTRTSSGKSRTASYNSSRSSSRPNSQYELDTETDDLMVSYPNNHLSSRRDPDDDMEHTRLPTISQPPQYTKRKSSSVKRPQRKRSLTDDYEVPSDLVPDAFYSEVLRVLSNIKMLESEVRNSSVVACQFKGVRFYITVNCGVRGKFHMQFEWISGGNEKYYSEIRDHIMNMLVL